MRLHPLNCKFTSFTFPFGLDRRYRRLAWMGAGVGGTVSRSSCDAAKSGKVCVLPPFIQASSVHAVMVQVFVNRFLLPHRHLIGGMVV